MAKSTRVFPGKRTQDLIQVDLKDEVLLYDEQTGRAHALNESAAAVWRGLDGATAPRGLAARIRRTFGRSSEDTVRLALHDFERRNLLEAPVTSSKLTGVTRRQMLRRLVAAGRGCTCRGVDRHAACGLGGKCFAVCDAELFRQLRVGEAVL